TPITGVRDNESCAAAGHAPGHVGVVLDELHGLRQHGRVGDRVYRDVSKLVERPPSIVVRRWIIGPESLHRENGANQRRIWLVHANDPITGGNIQSASAASAVGARGC